MKKRRAFCLFLAAAVCLGLMILPAKAADADQSVQSGSHSPAALSPLSDSGKLTETSKATIIYELNSDTLIYAWNPDERLYPSSMVKLMTALIAVEKGNLDDRIVVNKKSFAQIPPGSVSAGLKTGEELTLRDLLYCMMVQSANDAACSIAEYISGTQEYFVEEMNRRASELGCTSTHYTNVHGLHDPEMYTTARDICRLLDYALDIPFFEELFSTKTYTVPATSVHEERVLHTSNYMMDKEVVKKYFDPRVTGGKTGATDDSGRCLAATSEGNGMKILTIVMGATPEYEEDGLSLKSFGSFEETGKLLDYVYENYEYRQVFQAGQVVSQLPVEGGTNAVALSSQRGAATVLPKDIDETKLTWIQGSPGVLTAPVRKGEKLTYIQLWYGAKCLAQIDLVAANGVGKDVPETAAPTQPGEDPTEEKPSSPARILVIAAVAAVAVAVLIPTVYVAVSRASARKKRRRRRENRRRNR